MTGNTNVWKVSCLQMNVEFCSPESNYEKVKSLVSENAASADVLVLPETWNTGFFPKEELEDLCDKNGEKTKALIGKLAREYGVNIVAGSVANVKNGKAYNTAYIFDRRGELVGEYDKTHLFSPMDEHKFFEKGNKVCKFTLDGKNCGIIICYDIRFPELTRCMALDGLDCLFVVAQWPNVRISHLETLVKARAIENQTFAVCCNACGNANGTIFGGCSRIVDPWGNLLACAGEKEEIISAECDFSIVENIRKSINVFADRRGELYKK